MARDEYDTFGTLEKEFWRSLAILAIEEFGPDITLDQILSVFREIFEKNKVSGRK